jgi:choline dehydrogenase
VLTRCPGEVIVGAGAAGCVLANKLSEVQNISVLVLEAGGDNSKVLETKVPLMFPKLFHSEHDWDYYTVEQPGLASRRLYWPRGRVIGGSTSLNAMMYHHCSKSDFDEWASVHGCEGWSYDDLVPYLRRMEMFTPHAGRPAVNIQHHGTSGHWKTGYSWLSEILEKGFLPACHDAGIPSNVDINTPDGSLGATRFQTFIDPKGQRSSFATAYLSSEVLQRPNLYVACHARVARLLFDRLSAKDPIAIGVEFQTCRGADIFQVHARREVILCGGAVNTPQTLLLSGIGPVDELKKHNIPIIQENSAVGNKLKDHLCTTSILCRAKLGTTLDYLSSNIKALPALLQWLLVGSGRLTSNAGEAAAFIRSTEYHILGSQSNPPKDNTSGGIGPDVEIIGAPMAYIHHWEEAAADGTSIFSIIPVAPSPAKQGYNYYSEQGYI